MDTSIIDYHNLVQPTKSRAGIQHYIRKFFANVFISFHWAWMDTKCRYRRSVIGPLWDTINIFVLICGMAFVSGAVFNNDMIDIIPYIGLGVIAWYTIATTVNDSTGCFTGHKDLIKNSNLGIGVYVGRNVFRVFITGAHHLLIYFLGLVVLDIDFGWEALLVIPGIIILFLNALWVMPVFGMLCARFRDLEMIIKNMMQLVFFITPIFWDTKVISTQREFILDYNPFYYLIETIRMPLLGEVPPMHHYIVLCGITICGFFSLAVVYKKMRKNLAFYV